MYFNDLKILNEEFKEIMIDLLKFSKTLTEKDLKEVQSEYLNYFKSNCKIIYLNSGLVERVNKARDNLFIREKEYFFEIFKDKKIHAELLKCDKKVFKLKLKALKKSNKLLISQKKKLPFDLLIDGLIESPPKLSDKQA